MRAVLIRMVRVETSGDGERCDPKGLTARGQLDRLEIPLLHRLAYEAVDFGEDLGGEDRFEAPFFAASCEAASPSASRASHSLSLTSTNSLVIARKRLYSAICARVVSTA
jgi:hypothetical protein